MAAHMTDYAPLQFNVSRLADRFQELKDKGFILIEDALPHDYCEAIVGFIDCYLDEQGGEHESGHVGTMQRIWSAEKYSAVLQDYKDKCSRILSTLLGRPMQPQKILAMRDKAIPFKTQQERDRFAKGRWHYDSWRDQYKIFLFLKDVGLDNGPFEFIPGTNGAFKRSLPLLARGGYSIPLPTSRLPGAPIRAFLMSACSPSSTKGIPACH